MVYVARTTKPLWLQFREANAQPSDLLEYFRVRTAPVPVEEIARELGARVFDDLWMREDGRIEFHDVGFDHPVPLIFVNASHHEHRKRFTIAHELGHLLNPTHALRTQHRNTAHGRPRKQETEANFFAANLLMPVGLINLHLRAGDRTYEDLARRFLVSPEAMKIRVSSVY